MPPKPKYTKEAIVNAAYELTREKGIDAVVAREIGKRLNTSASPIFTVWNSMEKLREDVWRLAKQKYQEYMADIFDYTPAFKEFGMRWVGFAAEEPNLYRLLFLPQRDTHSPYIRFKMDMPRQRRWRKPAPPGLHPAKNRKRFPVDAKYMDSDSTHTLHDAQKDFQAG